MQYLHIETALTCIFYIRAVKKNDYLLNTSFKAFAGSTLVHSTGGAAALAGIILLGARSGRFDSKGEAKALKPFAASSIPLVTVGVFILWLGWFGFNGGDHKQVEINQYIDEILNYRMQLASSFWNASFFKLSYAKNIIKEFNELDLDTNYLIKILQNEYGFSRKELDLQDNQLAKSEPNKETEKVKVNKSDDNNSIKVLLCKNFEKQFKYEVFLKEEYNNNCPSRAPIKVNFNEYKDKSLGTFSSNSSKFGLCVRKKLSKKASENTSYTPFLFSTYLPCEDNKKIFSTIDAKFDGADIYIEKNKFTKHILSFDDGYFEKKVVKKSDDNFLKAIDDVKASPETYLTLEEVDYLSKSLTNINFDNMMDLGESNLISFSNELQHLFGKRKKYTNKRIALNSQEKIAKIYVTDKKFLEKYPYKTILGMAYFEFFYAGQFYKEKEDLQKFKEQFPNVSEKEIKVVKNLYNLNQLREKMRESLGFTLDDKTTDVIRSYISLSKYLENSKPEKVKLNSYQKKQIKLYEKFNKELANYEKNIKIKSKNRITDDKFENLSKRYYKKILKTNSKIQKLKSKKNQENVEIERFKSLFKDITEIISITDKNLTNDYADYQLALDSIYFVKDILSLTKDKSTKKKYDQIWDDNLNIEEILSSEEIKYLNLLNQKSKLRKITKEKQFQSTVLNLINNNYPVSNLMAKVEEQFETKIKPIKINYGSFDEMKNWNKEDWANAWKGSIPLELNDIDGSIVNFTDQNVEDLKAQLALNNLKELVNTDDIEFIQSQSQDIQNSINNLNNTNISAILNQDFSITLDNYSKILAEDAINRFGDQFDAQTIQEIRDNANFENLTAIMNMEYGTNITSEEYESYWESAQYMNSTSTWGEVTRGVDLISNLNSYDAAAAFKELGGDLQAAADSIAQAASVGISTDLEAAAQGAGFDSFSDAVNAYNEQYGTNYTDEEAREALGQ